MLKSTMRFFLPLAVIALLVSWARSGAGNTKAPQQPQTHHRSEVFSKATAEADRLWAKGAFELARELYAKLAAQLDEGSPERAFAEFRELDSQWRSLSKADRIDSGKLQQALQQLEALATAREQVEGRDRLWAEMQESLGDFHWDRERTWRYDDAQANYEAALDYWGAARDVERARRRFLDILFRIAAPSWSPEPTRYGQNNNWISFERLRQATEIAREPRDRAFAAYLLAATAVRSSQSPNTDQRALRAFEELAEMPADLGFRDLALHLEGTWLLGRGLWIRDEEGNPTRQTEPIQALAKFRELTDQFSAGTSAYYVKARTEIEKILERHLSNRVRTAFAPGSDVVVELQHKNISSLDARLVRVELLRDLGFDSGVQVVGDWVDQIDLSRGEQLLERRIELVDRGEHRTHVHSVDLSEWLEGPLPVGAYVLETRSGDLTNRAFVLVTDVVIQLETSAPSLRLWCTEAQSGRPIAGAEVKVWTRRRGNPGFWEQHESTTGADGLAKLEIDAVGGNFDFLALLKNREHQAICTSWASFHGSSRGMRVYVVTDRPAYRPDQDVQWRLTARAFDGLDHTTPAGTKLAYTLTGPRGDELETGELILNEFGSASGQFRTTETMALGEYRLMFRDPATDTWIGQSTLFRLEEYKLPEFEVRVELPTAEDGSPVSFVLGDTVRAEIEARTYFGAPVAGGEVEVTVTRSDYHRPPTPRGEFAWFTESFNSTLHLWRGVHGGEQVLREDFTTDAEGRVQIEFDTPFVGSQESVYTISARVVDAARREVTGTGTVNVRKSAYDVELIPERTLVRPGSSAKIQVASRDANLRPVSVSGRLRLYRASWKEAFVDPVGTHWDGGEARRSFPDLKVWPPAGWHPLPPVQELELIETLEVTTSDLGTASFEPTLAAAGSYLVRWISTDPRTGEVSSEVWLHAADETTREIQLAETGLRLIFDETAFVEGQPGQVMVVTDASDRWVWLRVIGERLIEDRVLHLDGTVQLVTFEVDRAWIPNVQLIASEVRERKIRQTSAEVTVPPVQRFLDLQVTLDREEYRPGSEGQVRVLVTDADGEPVRTELSLSLFDASIGAISNDLAGDPRKFFYGHRRRPRTQRASSLQQWPFQSPKTGTYRGPGDTLPPNSGGGVESAMLSRKSATGHLSLDSLGYTDGVVMSEAFAAPTAEDVSGQNSGGEGNVVVRSDFRETALWLPMLTTGEDGVASATIEFPESTTRWKLVARGHTVGEAFGEHTGEPARTSLPLVLRLARPRFLVEGDEATLSIVLDNTTDAPLEAAVELEAAGLTLLGWLDGEQLRQGAPGSLEIPAKSSARRDFRVRADQAGTAELIARAMAGDVADAVQLELPVLEHGLEVLVREAGRLTENVLALPFEIPPAREGSIDFSITVSPSLAATMLDALPYLTRFPHGCLEQTLSRFVPAVVTMRTLEKLGVSKEQVATASFGGVEAAYAAKTQAGGRGDFERFDKAAQEGLARVLSWQKGDGSWAWFPGGSSDSWMTSYALWSLTLAKESKLEVPDSALLAADRWLGTRLVELRNEPEKLAFALFAQTRARALLGQPLLTEFGAEALEHLLAHRTGLASSGVALTALAAHAAGRKTDALDLALLLENGVTRVETPGENALGTARGGERLPLVHWGTTQRALRWSDSAIESTSLALSALVAIQPDSDLILPAMTWLVQNRRGAQWKSTRDTALAVLALCDYLAVSGEGTEAVSFGVLVDGEPVGSASLAAGDLIVPNTFSVESPTSGAHEVSIERLTGTAPLYWSVSASAFSLEDPIPARSSDLFVRRDAFRLVSYPTLLGGKRFERIPLRSGDTVDSGDRIEVVLSVQTHVALEYLLFEDHKPAGLEATELQSGTPFYASRLSSSDLEERFGASPKPPADSTPGDTARNRRGSSERLWVYRELRDDRICLFLDRLPEGAFEMSYTLRAETPGTFHGLPALGSAMYVPEVRGNSEELLLNVR